MSRPSMALTAAIDAFKRAIADGADEQVAFIEACLAYQQVYPCISFEIIERIVAPALGRSPSASAPQDDAVPPAEE
jgi:hypothetical protein